MKDPDTYEAQGRPATLTREECVFIIKLVQSEPGLFLEEIREHLYDSTGTLLNIEEVHRNLVQRLSITLKRPKTRNIRRSILAKFSFIKYKEYFRAEFLVFPLISPVSLGFANFLT